jgi:hypothetical protein
MFLVFFFFSPQRFGRSPGINSLGLSLILQCHLSHLHQSLAGAFPENPAAWLKGQVLGKGFGNTAQVQADSTFRPISQTEGLCSHVEQKKMLGDGFVSALFSASFAHYSRKMLDCFMNSGVVGNKWNIVSCFPPGLCIYVSQWSQFLCWQLRKRRG